jgi:hypothetical protein
MSKTTDTDFDSPSVISHIEMLQGIIDRMGANSSNCKNMAIASIVGILALSQTVAWAKFMFCGIFVIILFVIDSMYLGLERNFKRQHNEFIEKIKEGKPVEPFVVESSKGKRLSLCGDGMRSWSTLLFYTLLLAGCAAVSFLVI